MFQNYEYVTNDEKNINLQYTKQISPDDINLTSFLSNTNFFDHLCNICEILLNTGNNNRKKVLLNELKKINKILPSNVYIPFTNYSMRNYVIGSIPISECHIFTTKTRAPYMITLECFRLDEINYYLENLNLNNIPIRKEIRRLSDSDIKNKGFKNILKYNFPRRRKFSDDKMDNENKIKKEKNPLLKNKLIYLYENEVKFSKPITIKNFLKKDYELINKREKLAKIKNSKSNFSKTVRKENSKSKYKNLTKLNNKNLDETDASYIKLSENENNNNSIFKYLKNSKYQKLEEDIIKKSKFPFFPKIVPLPYNCSLTESERSVNQTIKTEESENKSSSNENNEIETNKNVNNENNIINKNSNNEKNNENSNNENNEINENENGISKIVSEINENSKNIFGETREEQTNRLKQNSLFNKLTSYKIFNIIIKSGEDLRQEQFASQLINEFVQIFKIEKVKCYLKPYEIIATGKNAGIIEVIPNSISIDQLKRKTNSMSLKDFYINYFGPINSKRYKNAIKNYIRSLAGYSLLCYFLQIKDRHNANIMIDNEGFLIHIDFGFMLSNAPGKGLKFEKAPFKLTNDLVEVFGGINNKNFDEFRKLLWKGFIALVKHYERILILVEMMFCGHGNNLPCFERGQDCINELKKRFFPKENMKIRDYMKHVDYLISLSLDNWRTKWYDKFQYYVQGILP